MTTATAKITEITREIALYLEAQQDQLPLTLAAIVDAPVSFHDLDNRGHLPHIYVSAGAGTETREEDTRADSLITFTVTVTVIDYLQLGTPAETADLLELAQAVRDLLHYVPMAGAEFMGFADEGAMPTMEISDTEEGLAFRSVTPIQYIDVTGA